jgi:hypothetical protein
MNAIPTTPSQSFQIPLVVLIFVAMVGLAILGLVFGLPIYAVVALYGIGFLFLVSQSPQIALALTFASAPLQTDVGGQDIKFSIAEVHVMLLFIYLLWLAMTGRRRLALTPPCGAVALYLAVCVISSFVSWLGGLAIVALAQMIVYFTAAVLVFAYLPRSTSDLFISLRVLVAVGTFLAIAGPATHFGLFGMNKNGIGGSLSCALLVALELWIVERSPAGKGMYLAAMVITAGGLLLSLSRGAWLGAVFGVLIILALRRRFVLLIQTAAVLAPVLVLCWMALPTESKTYATSFDAQHYNIRARLVDFDIAMTYFQHNIIFGSGVGIRKTYDATNVVMTVLAETGIVGLAAFSAIYASLTRMIWRMLKQVPPADADFTFIVVCAALSVSKLAHGMVDHFWSRGAITVTWASVGMATAVYLKLRRAKRPQVLEGVRR